MFKLQHKKSLIYALCVKFTLVLRKGEQKSMENSIQNVTTQVTV